MLLVNVCKNTYKFFILIRILERNKANKKRLQKLSIATTATKITKTIIIVVVVVVKTKNINLQGEKHKNRKNSARINSAENREDNIKPNIEI